VARWSLAQLVVMVMDLIGLAIQPVSKNWGQKRMLCGCQVAVQLRPVLQSQTQRVASPKGINDE